MPIWLQHSLAVALVMACALVVLRQLIQSLRGRECSKGCGGCGSNKKQKAAGRVVFLPVEWLGKRR